jgi:hypothetical protein
MGVQFVNAVSVAPVAGDRIPRDTARTNDIEHFSAHLLRGD